MKLHSLLIATLLTLTSCASPAPTPSATPLPTATPTPSFTETPSPLRTASNIFGAIPLNSVQAFNIEPIAQATFEAALQGFVASGAIEEFRVDSVAVFPSGDGLIAEIMYSLRTASDPWPDDFGTLGSDGWITGKCSRFDLVATETEHQLKNKRLCS